VFGIREKSFRKGELCPKTKDGWGIVEAKTSDAPVEHGVKSRNLIYTHWGHFQKLRDIVHNANASPALVLALAEVKQRNDGRLFILWRVVGDDILCPLCVLRVELERDL
jgi:hypothetical protein